MAFKPVNKEEMNKDLARVSINVKIVGDRALAFKKMCEDTKVSGSDLIVQMVHYCLDDAAKKG